MDLLLAKAKPISNSPSASVTAYLRRGKNLLCNNSQEKGVRLCERNSTDTKVSAEGGGGGDPGARAEILPCSL